MLRNLLRRHHQKTLNHPFYRQSYRHFLALLYQNREMCCLERNHLQTRRNFQKVDYSSQHPRHHQSQ
jgi:hypothetical protein